MTVREFLSKGIDIQCEIVFCYYNYNKDVRVICKFDQVADEEIRYIYVDEGRIYIEVESFE